MSTQSTPSQRTSVKRTPRVCLSLFLLFDSVYKMDISLRQTSYLVCDKAMFIRATFESFHGRGLWNYQWLCVS